MLFYTPQLLLFISLMIAFIHGDVHVGGLFRSISSGHPASCVDRDFDSTVSQTTQLLDNAMMVLDALAQPVPREDLWIQRLNMAAAMFGIKYGKKHPNQFQVIRGRSKLAEANVC